MPKKPADWTQSAGFFYGAKEDLSKNRSSLRWLYQHFTVFDV